jgi:hypothetical protein
MGTQLLFTQLRLQPQLTSKTEGQRRNHETTIHFELVSHLAGALSLASV